MAFSLARMIINVMRQHPYQIKPLALDDHSSFFIPSERTMAGSLAAGKMIGSLEPWNYSFQYYNFVVEALIIEEAYENYQKKTPRWPSALPKKVD